MLALAPAGTPPYKTTYNDFAPRLGVAYQIRQNQDRQTVLRGGFGVFYDLATSEAGNLISIAAYPFGGFAFKGGGTFPLDPATAPPPPINSANGIFGFDPHLKLPYTLEWNVALEQALGRQQILSASYVGAAGRRLLQSAFVNLPSSNFASAGLVVNAGTSSYDKGVCPMVSKPSLHTHGRTRLTRRPLAQLLTRRTRSCRE